MTEIQKICRCRSWPRMCSRVCVLQAAGSLLVCVELFISGKLWDGRIHFPAPQTFKGHSPGSSLLAFLGAEQGQAAPATRPKLVIKRWGSRHTPAPNVLLMWLSAPHRPGTGKQTSVFPAPLPFPGPLIPPPGPPPSFPSSPPICFYAWMQNFWPLPSHEAISCHFIILLGMTPLLAGL